MEEKKEMEVTPARMACLMEVAGKVAKQMTTSTWRMTFEEMEIVMAMIQREIDETRRKNEQLRDEKDGGYPGRSTDPDGICSTKV